MRSIIVKEKFHGKKLNTVLFSEFPKLNVNSLYKALRKKDIKINGIRISENQVVFQDDVIEIYLSDDYLFGNSEKKPPISQKDILYEDENIIAIDKPVSIEIIGFNSLTANLISLLGYTVYPCHRLDRNTTGIIIYAKNQIALNILEQKFKNREIEKHYQATCYGLFSTKSDVLTAYLFKDRKKSLVYISDVPKKGYQKIITEYHVIAENKQDNTSLIDITLHTGKTHQIRAHLAHIGHPIIGDGKYGDNRINKQFQKKYQMLESKSITFHFSTESGPLSYLNEKTITK